LRRFRRATFPVSSCRPWLELIFKPARATATEGGASVQYEAVIRNTGNAPARNVRLAARMFNSGRTFSAMSPASSQWAWMHRTERL
jgi:hypothetical protein